MNISTRTFRRLIPLRAPIVCAGLASVLASLMAVFAVAPSVHGATLTLFSNITGGPTSTNLTIETAGGGHKYAQAFVPVAGTANIVSLWAQCVGINCTASATVEIHADSNGHPSSVSLGAATFTASDALGGSPTCAVLSPAPALTGGSTYWAVLSSPTLMAWHFQSDAAGSPLESSDNGTTWHANSPNKTFSLKVEQATTGCAPHMAPNPAAGTTVADMYAHVGGKSFNTITIGNDGSQSLTLTGGSFSGPDAATFTLLQTQPFPEELAQAYAFPKSIGVNGVGILYVVCTGPTDQKFHDATLTMTSDDPVTPSISWPVRCLVDSTPPTITFDAATDGNNGWFKTSPALVGIQTQDPESGGLVTNITCTVDGVAAVNASGGAATASVSGEGDHVLSCTATDVLNNTSNPYSTSVRIDMRSPIITPGKNPFANAAGWNKTDVTVSFTCSDPIPGSGAGTSSIAGGGLFSAETAGTPVSNTGTCADAAGNLASTATSTVKIDRTLPVITPVVLPVPNAAGWNNTTVTVFFQSGQRW